MNNEISLSLEQQIKLKNVLFNAVYWLPTEELKKDATNLLLDMALQIGIMDETEILKLKVKMAMH
jgi:hypothetical protein